MSEQLQKVWRVDVPIWATAYIKADSAEEALKIAQGLEYDSPSIPVDNGEGDVPICGLDYDDPDLPDVSLSPAMTIHKVDAAQAGEIECVFDPADEPEEAI